MLWHQPLMPFCSPLFFSCVRLFLREKPGRNAAPGTSAWQTPQAALFSIDCLVFDLWPSTGLGTPQTSPQARSLACANSVDFPDRAKVSIKISSHAAEFYSGGKHRTPLVLDRAYVSLWNDLRIPLR